jgi:hypothetical protein
MKTILEVFYIRVTGKRVRYQRRHTNLNRRGGNPDAAIRSLIHEKRRMQTGDIEEQEFIVHSTSWRYEQPGKIILTYVAYSDDLEFKRNFHSIPLQRLRTIAKNSKKPASKAELERKVVSHAIRHIAFLIQSGDQEDFTRALKPETVKVFEKLWVSLAGKVF